MAELCPWNERRLPREMYVKFFVVHFIVIGAYSHLRHLRRERYNLHAYILIIACPLAGLSLFIVPLVVLLIQAILTRCDRAVLHKSMEILIGRIPSDTVLRSFAINDTLAPLDALITKYFQANLDAPTQTLDDARKALRKSLIVFFAGFDQDDKVNQENMERVLEAALKLMYPSLLDSYPDPGENGNLARDALAASKDLSSDISANIEARSDASIAFRDFTMELIALTRDFENNIAFHYAIDSLLDGAPMDTDIQLEAVGNRTTFPHEVGSLLNRFGQDTNADTEAIRDTLIKPFKINWKIARRIIVPLALLLQSITSIWLFFRRVNRGSDALYDHRILQLALLVLSVSIMTIVQITLRPQYPLQPSPSDPKTAWVYWLRPDKLVRRLIIKHAIYNKGAKSSGSILADSEAVMAMLSRVTEWLYEWIYLYGISSVASRVGLICDSPANSLNEIPSRGKGLLATFHLLLWFCSPYILAFTLLLGPFQKIWPALWRTHRLSSLSLTAGVFGIMAMVWSGPSPFHWWSMGLLDSVQQLWALFSVPLTAQEYASATYTPSAASFDGSVLHVTYYDDTSFKNIMNETFLKGVIFSTIVQNCTLVNDMIVRFNNTSSDYNFFDDVSVNTSLAFSPDWNRIWTYAHTPPTFPCPKAWKDPMADYVWWLA